MQRCARGVRLVHGRSRGDGARRAGATTARLARVRVGHTRDQGLHGVVSRRDSSASSASQGGPQGLAGAVLCRLHGAAPQKTAWLGGILAASLATSGYGEVWLVGWFRRWPWRGGQPWHSPACRWLDACYGMPCGLAAAGRDGPACSLAGLVRGMGRLGLGWVAHLAGPPWVAKGQVGWAGTWEL
ncbi:hypothetical protein E2562_034431 [Oryza meyeriana var. granulata]|uniref:Uncharacterized protein n=1 Tax=Oryza meyeriana var. granulata TaxID=110450 RepID=A0A6G1FF15_9ORYZ|nr:hypothetical protein E2562_034431 [Oryza meyeriana var. granulata]